ncbi:hypothetical protein [Saezia sanguinis]|uniref:hypothetical protein n=1 Tax=Saezia sanguinis TaxID=1965230 RepID=UPI00306461CD
MNTILESLRSIVDDIGTAPTLEEMPRRSLADKGIAGPTAAHVIEEVHVPFNLAYVTFTTGSTAFQNIVGVTHPELPQREQAVRKVMALAGIPAGAHAVFTYAPLVNVFSAQALNAYGLTWSFLKRSSRDAFILALCEKQPQVVVGESAFIASTLVDAQNLGFADMIPRGSVVLCAGTPLDLELLEVAKLYDWQVHDLYGCQEFGWLTLDGVPLRDDISLIPSPAGAEYRELLVGGMPLADSFIVSQSGHVCNKAGHIITYRRRRTNPEYDVYVTATTFPTPETITRAARSILRIKGRVVKVSTDLRCNAPATELVYMPSIVPPGEVASAIAAVCGPEKTQLFDSLVEAQVQFQSSSKTDPTWVKKS